MKRYFYTYSLAAAWMAKYFGMTFAFIGPDRLPLRPEIYGYIAPSSLHLLEPLNGDVLEGQCGGELVRVADVCNFDGQVSPEEAADLLRAGFHIIKRNGLAFHWPESEEAS